jgi:hypothetical protein
MAEKTTRGDMDVLVKGRLKETKQWTSKQGEIFYDNFLMTPAEDAFLYPHSFLVKSPNRLGRDGEDIEVIATVTTFVRTSENGIKFYDNHLWSK